MGDHQILITSMGDQILHQNAEEPMFFCIYGNSFQNY